MRTAADGGWDEVGSVLALIVTPIISITPHLYVYALHSLISINISNDAKYGNTLSMLVPRHSAPRCSSGFLIRRIDYHGYIAKYEKI